MGAARLVDRKRFNYWRLKNRQCFANLFAFEAVENCADDATSSSLLMKNQRQRCEFWGLDLKAKVLCVCAHPFQGGFGQLCPLITTADVRMGARKPTLL